MLNRTIFASCLALLAFLVPTASATAPQALVFSRVTTSGHGADAVAHGGLFIARGERVDQLTDDLSDAEPAFSPDGATIAFVRDGDLFSIRPDGSGERQLTSGAEADSRPQFSADGRKVVFERAAGPGAPRDLYAVGARGGGLRVLAASPLDEHEATISPNGKVLAFVRSAGGAGGGTSDAIFSSRLNGGGLVRLSRGGEDAFAPHYFAGGIVFDRGESSEGPAGFSDIYSMGADGAKPQKLVGGASSVYLQDVSADGKTMLFTRYESLCEKPIAGGAPRKIGSLEDDVRASARFSPDGRNVAVRAEDEDEDGHLTGAQRLYVLSIRGGIELSEPASIGANEDAADEIGPGFAWQPNARAAY